MKHIIDTEKIKDDVKRISGSKIVKGLATVAVLASIITGIAFSGPGDINPEQLQPNYKQPPVVLDLDEYANATVDDDDEDEATQEKKQSGIFAKFRQAVMSLPQSVRLLVITPLWAIGTAIMTVISATGRIIFGSPIGAFIAAVLIGFGILAGLYGVTAHVLFPDVPMKKIFSKEALITLGVVSLLLAGLDAVAPLFWNKYPLVAALVKLAVGAGVIGILSVRAKNLHEKFQRRLGLA